MTEPSRRILPGCWNLFTDLAHEGVTLVVENHGMAICSGPVKAMGLIGMEAVAALRKDRRLDRLWRGRIYWRWMTM